MFPYSLGHPTPCSPTAQTPGLVLAPTAPIPGLVPVTVSAQTPGLVLALALAIALVPTVQ